MDRRRYIPHLDGLETRVVLSTAAASVASQAAIVRANADAASASTSATTDARTPATSSIRITATTAANAQATASWKATRIQRLPFMLYQTSRTRVVPPELLKSLQYDLTLMTNNLRRPSPAGLQAFNDQIRATMPRQTIRLEDAVQLNATFGKILADAGTVPWLVQKFQNDMNELARIDSFQRNSASLVANDYGLILQVALGVGVVRPGTQAR